MSRWLCGVTLTLLTHVSLAAERLTPPMFQTTDPRPWVVMVTQPGCSYCERLEREILQPLRASKLYDAEVRFTAVDIGINPMIIDFDGTHISSSDFASKYQGHGTPTLLFLSASGDVLAPAKYGLPDAIDFYAYAIEQTIEALLENAKRP